MRTVITLLSLLMLSVIGLVGEALINWLHSPEWKGARHAALTQLVWDAYPLNAGDFGVSLTPFGVLFVGMLLLSIARRWAHQTFLLAFAAIWLCIGIYFGGLVLAILLPYELLLTDWSNTALVAGVYAFDGLLVAIFAFLCGRAIRKRKRLRAES